MRKLFIVAAAIAALTAPALANECEDAINAVTAALETSELNDEDKAAVTEMIESATQDLASGQIEACMETTEEAMALLGE